MNKVRLIKRVDKATFILAVTNFILWIGLFISLFWVDYNTNTLKRLALGATFIVVMDIFFDIVNFRRKSNGKVQ